MAKWVLSQGNSSQSWWPQDPGGWERSATQQRRQTGSSTSGHSMSSRFKIHFRRFTSFYGYSLSEPIFGLVSCVQGSLHQLDAQPALPGRQERVWGGADYGGASQVSFSWFSSLHLFVHIFSLHRQPNEQARVVAPVVDGATLKEMSFASEARNLIIVRHPFER